MRWTLFLSLGCLIFMANEASALEKKQLLYVGTQAGCNEGIITLDQNFLNCTTAKFGYTIDDADAKPEGNFIELFAGVTPTKNDGYVSPDRNHKNGATTSIGFLSVPAIPHGVRLYSGSQSDCNDGEATPNNMHKNCTTRELGYALPK
ncbi:hypothetical protein NKJ74_31400 [Mesorhizobium sp. M0046]|uniref:hypothetical protein n=1 Tax=Mesorhizobium sp. M0046 TaxID=2956858 RepID=UPI00333D5C73